MLALSSGTTYVYHVAVGQTISVDDGADHATILGSVSDMSDQVNAVCNRAMRLLLG